MLDVRTLFFTAALFSVFEAGALVYVWLTRRTYPGFSQWTQALVAGGGGTVLIFLRGVLPDVLTYDLSSLLLLLSAVLMLAGSARFFAAPRNLARRWWLMGACWLGLVYFRAGEPNYAIRVVLASLALGVLYLDHAALLFGRPQPGLRRTCRVWAVLFACYGAFLLVRAALYMVAPPPGDFFASLPLQVLTILVPQMAVLGAVILAIVLNAQRLEMELQEAKARAERSLEELKTAQAEVKTLSGLLPICAGCKKIRDDQGYWNQIETYIARHSDATFTHGLCPECLARLYPDLAGRLTQPETRGK